jgi:hypothetical protein
MLGKLRKPKQKQWNLKKCRQKSKEREKTERKRKNRSGTSLLFKVFLYLSLL